MLLTRQGDCLVAVGTATEIRRWTCQAEGQPLLPGAHTAATPAVADRQVYAAFSDGSVSAIDIETATLRWHHQTEGAELLVRCAAEPASGMSTTSGPELWTHR